jgi:ribonuclease R
MADRNPDLLAPYLALLERKTPRPLTVLEMVRLLGIDRYDRKALRAGLERAVASGQLRRIGKSRYQWRRESDRTPTRRASRPTTRGRRTATDVVPGRYTRVRAGFGFVEPLGRSSVAMGRDILVPAGMEGDARHGDEVTIEIIRRDPHRRRVVGRVAAVTNRAHESVIGTIERQGQRWFLVPLNALDPPLPLGGVPPTEAQEGMVALARPPRDGARTTAAAIERVLGDASDPEVQFLCIAFEHNLRTEFPPPLLREADALPTDPDARDIATRRDLRALSFVTIDGETARDFDDAVCLEPLSAGGVRLWVAIADVSHYVTPGSALDGEAAARGTSVYFPDRAIPMLPPRLSSELCSLMPDRDRLVIVVELLYDRSGARRGYDCYRAVMRSRARLTYTEVAAVLSDTKSAEVNARRRELAALLPMLERMRALMQRLYARRLRDGSLDLDLPEALIDLSEAGRSIGVRFERRNDAHRLIEEFMLEANRAVAEHLREHELPLPYRIHEAPEPDDVDELNELLGPYGLHVAYDEVVEPATSNACSISSRTIAWPVLSRQVLRALRHARYSTVNARHFGLAFPVYCHFTSPIRRYPDLLVHRQLGHLFDGEEAVAGAAAERLEAASQHSSQAERSAMEAERAMLDLKKCEFMLDHLLEPEAATVVSVTKIGLFVELDAYPIEGLVRADDIPGDRWVFLDTEHALKGMRTNQRFRLGDRVRWKRPTCCRSAARSISRWCAADAAGASVKKEKSKKTTHDHADPDWDPRVVILRQLLRRTAAALGVHAVRPSSSCCREARCRRSLCLVFLAHPQPAEREAQRRQNRHGRERCEDGHEADARELHHDLLGIALDARAERDGEDTRGQCAPGAAERVHAEHVERVVVTERRLHERAGQVGDAGDADADGDGAHRRHVAAGGRDRDQAGDRRGRAAERGRRAAVQVFDDCPRHHGRRGSGAGVEEGEARERAGAQRAAGVEAEPSRSTSRRRSGTAAGCAASAPCRTRGACRASAPRRSPRTARHVHDEPPAKSIAPALKIQPSEPHHVRDRAVHHQQPDADEGDPDAELHALGDGAEDQRRGDDREHRLEHDEDVLGCCAAGWRSSRHRVHRHAGGRPSRSRRSRRCRCRTRGCSRPGSRARRRRQRR